MTVPLEKVEIVDKNLNVLYVTSKDEAHKKGLLHKCTVAQLINSKGQFMLIKPYSTRQDAGQYVCPVGGHVSAGEKDDDALKREVEEEIGLKRFGHKLKGKAIFDRHVIGRHENHYFIFYEIYSDEEPILGNEAETARWFTPEEIKKETKTHSKEFGDAYFFVLKNFYKEFLL